MKGKLISPTQFIKESRKINEASLKPGMEVQVGPFNGSDSLIGTIVEVNDTGSIIKLDHKVKNEHAISSWNLADKKVAKIENGDMLHLGPKDTKDGVIPLKESKKINESKAIGEWVGDEFVVKTISLNEIIDIAADNLYDFSDRKDENEFRSKLSKVVKAHLDVDDFEDIDSSAISASFISKHLPEFDKFLV